MWIDTLTTENVHIVPGDRTPIRTTNKWELIESLKDALCRREKLDASLVAEIDRELIAREKLMSTGIGEQMAIPHAVVSGAGRFMTEMAVIKDGIDFESIDGTRTFIVVLLVAPKSALHEHLKVMASIAQVFYKPEARQKVIAASTAAEVLAAIKGK